MGSIAATLDWVKVTAPDRERCLLGTVGRSALKMHVQLMELTAMVRLIPWIERQWAFNLPIGAFPSVLERLQGTPARAADLVAGASDASLSHRPAGKWSVKEHLGHLNDMHALDVRRVEEFIARADTLSAADMSNTKTHEAGHGAAPIDRILATFRRDRRDLVTRLELLSEADIAATAMHPRLKMRIRLIDWAEFVSEHDDHHLAAARDALRSAGSSHDDHR